MVKSVVLTVVSVLLIQNIHGYPTSQDFSQNDTATHLGYFSTPYDEVVKADSDRIYGGYYASDGEFPFMAIIHRLMGNGYIAQCGGTIITNRWILTAGHCVATEPRQFLVVLGTSSQSGIGYNSYVGNGVAMITTEGALHPAYSKIVNDVGLLRMPQDIPFSSNIQQITIDTGYTNGKSLAGQTGTVIGWGRDSMQSLSTTRLKYANIPLISNQACGSYWIVDDRNICTEPSVGQDACQGDSGGPLVLMQSNGQLLQVGIVSYGDEYCPSTKPGVFSRISTFNNWIQAVTNLQY